MSKKRLQDFCSIRTMRYQMTSRDLIVVRREPELVQREAKRLYCGDDEKVATVARKIAVILHRIWIDGTTYRWAEAKPIAAQA
jgi:hypothetical protein